MPRERDKQLLGGAVQCTATTATIATKPLRLLDTDEDNKYINNYNKKFLFFVNCFQSELKCEPRREAAAPRSTSQHCHGSVLGYILFQTGFGIYFYQKQTKIARTIMWHTLITWKVIEVITVCNSCSSCSVWSSHGELLTTYVKMLCRQYRVVLGPCCHHRDNSYVEDPTFSTLFLSHVKS